MTGVGQTNGSYGVAAQLYDTSEPAAWHSVSAPEGSSPSAVPTQEPAAAVTAAVYSHAPAAALLSSETQEPSDKEHPEGAAQDSAMAAV